MMPIRLSQPLDTSATIGHERDVASGLRDGSSSLTVSEATGGQRALDRPHVSADTAESMACDADAQRVALLGLSPDKLRVQISAWDEKPFRSGQLLKWIHQRGVLDPDQMTDLSKAFRARLAKLADFSLPEVAYEKRSADGTTKWVLRLADGNAIETVFIPDGDRGTLCVSSQVGCALDCTFCSTAQQGFNRNLSTAEIIAQLWIARARLPIPQGCTRAVTNVVFMGMGEPLANYDAVLDSIRLMLDDEAYGLSKRRVTVSTSGLVPALARLARDVDVSLAVSLHAPTDDLRDRLVPINRKYPIAMLLDGCRDYLAQAESQHLHITFEYVLLEGINDSLAQARALARLLRGIPCKINLIPFNPFPGAPFRRPSEDAVLSFERHLIDAGYITLIRRTRGDDIDAACGQLVGQVVDRSRRTERMVRLHRELPQGLAPR